MARKKKAGAPRGGVWELSKIYPTLADAVLTYDEFDFSGVIKDGVHSVRRHGHVVACSNALCHQGGYDLRAVIKRMMHQGETTPKVICIKCKGWETRADHGPAGNVCTGAIEGTLQLKMRRDVKPKTASLTRATFA